MDNVTIVSVITLFGAAAGTFIPYILKVWKDPEVSFDMNYGYALLLSIVVQVATLLPDEVPVMNMKVLIMAFAQGYGIQSIVNKAIPK